MWGNIGNFADLAKAAEELQKQAASQITAPTTPFGGGFFNMDSLLQQEEQQKHKQPPKGPHTSSHTSQQQQQQQSSSSSFATSFVSSVPTSPTPFGHTTPTPKGTGGSLLLKPLVAPVAQTRPTTTTTPGSPPLLLSPSSISRSPSTIKKGQLKIPLPIKTTTTAPTTKKEIDLVAGSTMSSTNIHTKNSNSVKDNYQQNPEHVEDHNDEIQNGHAGNTINHPQSPPGSLSFVSSSPLSTTGQGGAFEKVTAGSDGDGKYGSITPQLPTGNLANPETFLPQKLQKEQLVVSSRNTDKGSDAGFLAESAEESLPLVALVVEDPEKKPILKPSPAGTTSPISATARTTTDDDDEQDMKDPATTMTNNEDDDEQHMNVLTFPLVESETTVPLMSETVPSLVGNNQQQQQLPPFPVQNQGDEAIELEAVTTTTTSSSGIPDSAGDKDNRGNGDNNNTGEGTMMMRMMGVMESVGVPATSLSSTLLSASNDEENINFPDAGQSRTTMNVASLDHTKDAELLKSNFSSQLARLVENHQLEQQQLQQQYEQKLQELSLQLQQNQAEYERQVEGWRLQRDSLKHELEGTQELLTAKKNDERKLQNAHLKELRNMEKQVNEKEKAREALQFELDQQEKLMEQTKEELQVSRDEYATLKERVMVVAGELKDRRAECRTLQSEVALLKDNNDALHDQIIHLEAQGMDLNKSSTETTNELNGLKGQLMDKEKELQAVKDSIKQEIQKVEEALAAYKRKAQQSLSVANSRTASAVQAKEDAEMEARAARSTADSAMERAIAAERKGADALAEAKAYVSEMKGQVARLEEVKSELESTKIELEHLRSESNLLKATVDKQRCELQSVHGRFEAEQMTTRDLRTELTQAIDRSTELLDEVERLRREGKRLKEDLQRKSEEPADTKSTPNGAAVVDMVPAKRSAEAEATIAMLQQELDDANQAIRELKETLKATAEDESRAPGPNPNNGGNRDSTGGMPLFYAMEKQAELTQARNEVARLAALVGNSEASRQEAMDEMEEMRKELEELQSKLQRESRHGTPQEERVNLEYLKHVILSFLNAKTQLEKKTLLPVIGAVLCLTPQEQQHTLQHLDQEGKMSLESMTSSVLNLKWS